MIKRERIIDIGGNGNDYRIGYSPRSQKIYELTYANNGGSSPLANAFIDYRIFGIVLLFILAQSLSHFPPAVNAFPIRKFLLSMFISVISTSLVCVIILYLCDYYYNFKMSSSLGKIENLTEDSIKKVKEIKQEHFVLAVASTVALDVLTIAIASLLAFVYFVNGYDSDILFFFNMSLWFVVFALCLLWSLNRPRKYRRIVLKKIELLEETRQK